MATTLYAYALGTDLDDVASRIEARLDELIAERTWRVPDVWVVNQRTTPAEWDLGLNLTLPPAAKKRLDWIEDAVAIASAFGELHRDIGRRFVLGVQRGTNDAKDIFVIDRGDPDLDKLRNVLTSAVA